ncbi:hypothetical protein KM043_002102 [Ampulex compressa]|nr:hypothetical protein KM043_002102 [Ampulex compressa]
MRVPSENPGKAARMSCEQVAAEGEEEERGAARASDCRLGAESKEVGSVEGGDAKGGKGTSRLPAVKGRQAQMNNSITETWNRVCALFRGEASETFRQTATSIDEAQDHFQRLKPLRRLDAPGKAKDYDWPTRL